MTTPTFPTYSSVGCYPLFYLDEENNIYCSSCAQETEASEPGTVKPNGYPNWEDPNLYCDCGTRIESAYADDEDPS